MSKTKHLDTAIAILSGAGMPKRAKRKVQVEIIVEVYADTYGIQMNGKLVESGEGSKEYAMDRADARAARVRALGKTVVITVY